MAKNDEIAAATSGALEGGAAALPGAFAVGTATTLAGTPIPGARLAAIAMVGIAMAQKAKAKQQQVQAKAMADQQKEAMKQDKQAQKLAKQRGAISQQSKKDDALLASSMGGGTTQPTLGTQYDRFQADTFGAG